MNDLRIAEGFRLPADVAGEVLALLGKRGSGKTNTAIVLVEELDRIGVQFVVLDPVGSWWGIRSKIDAFILGGQHGDVPLDPAAGRLIADVVFESGQSFVLDLSTFPTKSAVARFVTDFLDQLYRRLGADPRLVHVVLEEADEFAPQKPFKEDTRMLSAVETAVRRGRARGLGMTLITQRSAVLNKNVLEQADVLVAMRLTGPNDRKAIESWVGKHAAGAEGDSVIASLPTLDTGQAWFWNPERDLLRLVGVRARRTLDVSGRLRPGQAPASVSLKAIDLAKLGERIEAEAEKARENDPAELRKRIRELQRELDARAPAEAVEKVEVPVFPAVLKDSIRQDYEGLLSYLAGATDHVEAMVERARERLDADFGLALEIAAEAAQPTVRREIVERLARGTDMPLADPTGNGELPVAARRFLETLARHHPVRLSVSQMAVLAGRKARGGSFNTAMRILRDGGYVDESGGSLGLSDRGLAEAGVVVGRRRTPEETQEQWREALPAAARDLFDVLVARHPESVALDDLAALTGRQPRGGSWNTAVKTLVSNDLAEKNGFGLRASDSLFLA